MTTIRKIIVFSCGIINVVQRERDIKREIEEKGLEKFLQDNKLLATQRKEAVAN